MKKMIKGHAMQVVVVIAVVSVLGLITVIMGVAGASSSKESVVRRDDDGVSTCKYSSTSGVGFGIVAMLFVLTTQIVATAVTGCCGCCRSLGIPTDGKRITALVLSTVSWILAIIVMILFIIAAIGSAGGEILANGDGTCDRQNKAAPLFASATVMFLIAVVSQIISYVLLQTTMAVKSTSEEQSRIPMGQPPAPAPNASAPPAESGPVASTPPPPPPAPAPAPAIAMPSDGSAADPTSQV